MPWPSKKSAPAKTQQCQGINIFNSAQYSDSASDYTSSQQNSLQRVMCHQMNLKQLSIFCMEFHSKPQRSGNSYRYDTYHTTSNSVSLCTGKVLMQPRLHVQSHTHHSYQSLALKDQKRQLCLLLW